MFGKNFAVLLENHNGEASKVIVLKLGRTATLILMLVLLAQACLCGAAAWTLWRNWQDRQSWNMERQQLIENIEAAKSGPTQKKQEATKSEPQKAEKLKSAPENLETIKVELLRPETANGESVKKAAISEKGESTAKAPIEAAEPAIKAPSGTAGEARLAAEPDTTEIDSGVVNVSLVELQRRKNKFYYSFEVRAAKDEAVSGQMSCWLLDKTGHALKMPLEDPSFKIRRAKIMSIPLTGNNGSDFRGKYEEVIIEASIGGKVVLRARRALPG